MTKLILTREQILNAPDLELDELRIPEWDKDGQEAYILIKPLTVKQRADLELKFSSKNRGRQRRTIRETLTVTCVVSQTGQPLFTDADVDALSQKNGAALERIIRHVIGKSGFADDDLEKLED